VKDTECYRNCFWKTIWYALDQGTKGAKAGIGGNLYLKIGCLFVRLFCFVHLFCFIRLFCFVLFCLFDTLRWNKPQGIRRCI